MISMPTRQTDKKRDHYVFLPVTCPKCHTEGKVRISRMASTFKCAKCHRDFYITPSGTVTGERPPEAKSDPYAAVTSPKGWFVRNVERLPRAAWWSLGGVLLTGVTMALAVSLLAEPEADIPESMDGRAQLVAEAVARGNYRRLKSVVPRSKYIHAVEWAKNARPAGWPSQIEDDQSVYVQLETVFKNSKPAAAPGDEAEDFAVATAGVAATVLLSEKHEPFSFTMYWEQNSELQWMLDVARTSKEGTR